MQTTMKEITREMFAPVDSSGRFSFHEIRRSSKEVKVLPSDATYGGAKVKALQMKVLPEPPAAPVDANAHWSETGYAWIIKNPDDTFWMDTLELTRDESIGWCSNYERSEKLGFVVVPVQFKILE